jgi:tetratricopeptide (TPR) repeat protein
VANLLGLSGSIKKGISELENVVNKDSFYKDEAQMILFLVQAYMLKINTNELQNFQKFVENNPDNQLFQFFLSSVLMKEGKGNLAFQLLEKNVVNYPFPIIDYLKGEIYLQKGMYVQAKVCYTSFLQKHKGINFIKDANYKLFLCCWLNNEEAKGLVFLENVTYQGRLIVESDKSAMKFSKSFLAKNSLYKNKQRVLMKARLAFDGGFYEEAKQILLKWKESNFELLSDKAEFNYRKGRIAQKLLETTISIAYFERAILLSEKQEFVYGALSALQIGSIYQEKAMKETAKLYYKKAISFKNHEYKNSTDNKAKAALNEMGYR